MSKLKASERWVVTSAVPSPTGDPRACFTRGGVGSKIPSTWVQFHTHLDAMEWAEKSGIEINGTTHCIVIAKLSAFDISRGDNSPE